MLLSKKATFTNKDCFLKNQTTKTNQLGLIYFSSAAMSTGNYYHDFNT